MKEQCTKQDGRTITIGKHYDLVKKAKEYNKSQEFNEDQRVRAHIEPKQAEMKRFHGLVRAKYCGCQWRCKNPHLWRFKNPHPNI
jgi:transposase